MKHLRFYAVLLAVVSFWGELSGCAVLSFAYGAATESMPPILTAPPFYSASVTEGTVIDLETKQPLEGVIVGAYWELRGFHGYPVGLMMVQETVTDAQGRFMLPAWGPKARSPITGELRSPEPRFLAFKSGYDRQYDRPYPFSPLRDPHDPYLLKLKQVPEDSKEYASGLSFLDGQVEFAFRYDDCAWKQIPRMLVALHLESKRSKERGFHYPRSIENREGDNHSALAKCGSLREFFRGYLP